MSGNRGFGLTARQRELWMYLSERETCPSFEEMRAALGLKARSGIHRLLGGLEERGFIRRIPHRPRAIELLSRPDAKTIPMPPTARTEVLYLPLHGRIE